MLFESTSVGRAKELIDHVSFPLLAAGATALLAASPFSAVRWHLVLAAETTSPGPWTLLKIVLVGLFFNQLFPSGVGGDAVRAWRCHRLGIGVAAAIRSLVLDRVNTIQPAIDDPAFYLVIDGIVGVIATVLADGRKR